MHRLATECILQFRNITLLGKLDRIKIGTIIMQDTRRNGRILRGNRTPGCFTTRPKGGFGIYHYLWGIVV